MSKSKPTKPKGAQHSHRPLLPTNAAIDNIKNQFKQHISNKVVVQGADYKKTETEVSEEQLHEEASKQEFYPFPTSGLILEWVSNPARPGIFVIVVNLEKDPTKEPHPGFFATCRQPEVAQMLCDGVNFLYKAQKEMEKVGAPELVAPQVFSPVVLPDKVDGTPTPDVTSER